MIKSKRKFQKVCFMIVNLKRDFFFKVKVSLTMDWIRRNFLFFKSKASKKTEKDAKFDEEFIDIIEEEPSKQQKSVADSPLESPVASESQEDKPIRGKKEVRKPKPLNHQIVCLSEAAPDNDLNDIEPVIFVPNPNPQKPKNCKKNLINNQPQANAQFRNNIIYQPR